jgi:hypothetical protein
VVNRACAVVKADQEDTMRFLIPAALAAIAYVLPLLAVGAEAAPISSYPWCAHYSMKGGARSCSFRTFEDCLANVSGIGGNCAPSPYYVEPPLRVRKKRRHVRR